MEADRRIRAMAGTNEGEKKVTWLYLVFVQRPVLDDFAFVLVIE